MGKEALPYSVAPSEVESSIQLVESTNFRFGFDYCHYVLEDVQGSIERAVMAELDSDSFNVQLSDPVVDVLSMQM